MRRHAGTLLAALALLMSCAAWGAAHRIGVLVPLSGPKAEKGQPMKQAAELFVAQFNAAAGGNALELVVRDDFNDPEKARAVAAEMARDPSLLAVVGHYYPEIVEATAPVFAAAGIPLLSPNVSNPPLLAASRWLFTINYPDDVQGAFMAVYIKEVLKKDDVLVVHNNDPFGLALRDAFVAKAARIGLRLHKVLAVDRRAVPADWAATHLPDPAANARIGIVAALTHSESGLGWLPLVRAQGIAAPVMAPNTWTNPKFLSDLDEKHTAGVYVASPFLWEIANRKASLFAQAYEKKFVTRPPVSAAMVNDALLLLTHALAAAPTRAGIRDFLAALDALHAVEGATGHLYFSDASDRTSEYMARYAAAKPVPAAARPSATAAENRAVRRDVFVSVMKDGRFKSAPVQLLRPREEYVLRELPERIANGEVMIADGIPYHLVDVVFVGVDVIRINDVNIRDMLWDVDVFMWFKWAGGRLDVADIEKIGAVNAVREQSTLLKENLAAPLKYRAYRKRLTLGAPYDLTAFPFDSQLLPLSLAHANKNSTHIMLVPDARHMEDGPVDEIKPQEWSYAGRHVFSDLYRYESTFGDPDYRLVKGYKSPIYFSSVNLEIGIQRILKPYLYTFFLPLAIILGIILMVLWVPLDQFAPRINASISGLVGILVYHMSQKNAFPKVGYTMVADYYFLAAYALVVAITVCIIFTQMMMAAGQKDLAKQWNHRLAIGSVVAVVGIYTLLTLIALYFAQPALMLVDDAAANALG